MLIEWPNLCKHVVLSSLPGRPMCCHSPGIEGDVFVDKKGRVCADIRGLRNVGTA